MKLFLPSLLFISSIFIFSCKKDIARNITGNYNGAVDRQDLRGNLYVTTQPVPAKVTNTHGDSVIVTIGSEGYILFSKTLPVISKSEFGNSSLDNQQIYHGTIKGDSLIFSFVSLATNEVMVYKARKN